MTAAADFGLAWVRCSRSCWRAGVTPSLSVHVHSDGLVVFHAQRRILEGDALPVQIEMNTETFGVVVSRLRAYRVVNMTALRTAVESLLTGLGWKTRACINSENIHPLPARGRGILQEVEDLLRDYGVAPRTDDS